MRFHPLYWRLVVTIVAVGSGGCLEPERVKHAPTDDVPMDVVIARVNRNSAAMDFLLKAGAGSAGGEFKRGGRRESFQLTATMLCRKPRDLYIKLEHLGGTIEAGSNAEEFWFWEKTDKLRYWWGRHEFMADDDEDIEDIEPDMPFRPDLLAEVLGLSELPTDTTGPEGPLFLVGSNCYELMFLKSDAKQQLCYAKAVNVDRFPPFLIRSVMYFRRDGHPLMLAKLSDYRNISGIDVLAPHHILIDWLTDKGTLALEFGTMERFDKPAAEKRFLSPLRRGLDVGMVERVDHPPLPETMPSTRPEPSTEP